MSEIAAVRADLRGPRWRSAVATAEAVLTLAEAALCGLPAFFWVSLLPGTSHVGRIGGPVAAALWTAALVRLLAVTKPVSDVVRLRHQGQAVSPQDADAAERAVARAPRESALVHFILWLGAAATLAVVSPALDPWLVAGLASVVVFHATAASALRAVVLDRLLSRMRPVIAPQVEGIRAFATGYRFGILSVVFASLGLAHAVFGLMTAAFVDLSPRALGFASLLLWPMLAVAGLRWSRSFLRRTKEIEQFFDGTLRAPGTRGPARNEPLAVRAFVAAQELPYRLAGYQAFSFALAGIVAIIVERRLGLFGVAAAARMLGILAIVVTAIMMYETLALRALLGPLMRHLGSRHILPLAEVRSRIGLRSKLVASFAGAVVCAGGAVALWAFAPVDAGTSAHFAFAAGMVLSAGLAFLVANEVVRPIQALEARSDEMSRGELARPVAPAGEADEIGRLTVAFEEMRRSLRDRLRSTESINIDLEREVRRRTEALEQRNTELREAVEKLRRAQDNLIRSEKLASMGRLVAGIAHEINNPVNAVINSLEPLDEVVRKIARESDAPAVAALTATAGEMLGVIQRGAARTMAIVQALHNYSRGDESKERVVDLGRSVDDALDLLRHRLRNVTVVKEVDPAARVMGFPGQIDQVLLNLITNAEQAIAGRGGTIRIAAVVRDDGVEVTVADDGPGIPADVLPRIFDPFFTTKPVGEGSGLGLSIVHGIVERHGGQIDVDSAPGKGTTFTLRLPQRGAAATQSGAA